jgi:glycosyltransferase involved in cell wall biosynthesis
MIAGRGRYEEDVKRIALRCPRIEFLGLITPGEVLDRTSRSDVVFSMLDPRNENYRIATPIKVLEAMAMGVPVMVSKGTWSADIVERVGCGVALDWSPTGFDEAVALLMDPERRKAMGDKGRKAAESEFNWKLMKERLLTSYRHLSEGYLE